MKPPIRSAERSAHPYADFVAEVQKPARYLGGEYGTTTKDWNDPAITAKVCLGFPDIYDIGMSHLGLKILYSLINAQPDVLAERAFSPWVDMDAQLRKRGLPLVSLESARPLRDFDVVGLSLQFELTYTNCLQILDLGGIPLRNEERSDTDPLVVAGGPTATHPEPLAPFIDAFVIGDGEEAFPELIRAWATTKGQPRADRLRALAEIGGVYVPALYETAVDPDTGFVVVDRAKDGLQPAFPVRRALVPDLNRYPFPADGPIPVAEAIFDRMSIEIARGCTEGCRFCQAGMIYRPVRERDPESVIETVTKSLKHTGYDEVALTSLSTADYSCVSPLVREVMSRLEKERVSLSVSSLRAYGLDEELLDEIQKVRATGLTFAPEAGTQRMRDVVNKNVTEAQLMTTAERVFSRGWSKMKLYFMIGLPTERDEDVRGIIDTGKKALELGKRAQRGRGPSVTVSVSTFVPKPHTPFQWAALDALSEIRRKQSILHDEARRTGVDLKTHDAPGSVLEGVLARGDRKVGEAVLLAYRRGAKFDSWEEHLDLARWQQAFADAGVDMQRYVGTIPLSARLPWTHIDVGLEDGFLAREYRKALKDQLSPPCGKAAGVFVHHTNVENAVADKRKIVCYDCGIACDLSAMRQERLVALKKLGADGPVPIDLEKRRPRSPEERRPRAKFTQGEPRRYRLRYTKTGPAAFVSHLDLIRALPRVFRRMDVPLFYSQGFHPKPDLSFGPALSLGVASLDEYVDAKITADLEVDELAELLDRHSQEGVTIEKVVRLEQADAGIANILSDGAFARYVVGIPKQALPQLGMVARPIGDDWVGALRAEVEGQLEGGSLTVVRTVEKIGEGIGKKIDVRRWLDRVTVAPEPRADSRHGGAETLARAGIVGNLVPVEIDVALSGQGGVKVTEVVEALLGRDVPFRAVRAAMWAAREGRRVDPMDVAALRAIERTASASAASVTPPSIAAGAE
ncbi:MAG: TIGR03960 family B12-binding radical SAM protein [Deltaproteobacteria bacterium]|nr:TIGR03960 family B12-binding radical SAM protein [Deltaproteobacteria bacterium]